MKAWLRSEGLAVLRAYAQVLFLQKAGVGAALLLLTLLTPASGLGGLLAVVVAHAASARLGYRQDLRAAGAFGYNAALLGLFLPAGRGLDLSLLLLIALAAAASVLLYAVLSERLHRSGGLPVLVLPFVLLGVALQPAIPDVATAVMAPIHWLPDVADPATWWGDALHGLGAVFCLHGAVAGAVVLALLVAATRLGALATLTGVFGALLAQRLADVPAGSQLATCMVYNGALTGLSLGAMLLAPGRASLLVALLAAMLASLLCVGLTPAMQRLQLPLLSAPFVLVTLFAARALQLRLSTRPPFAAPLPGSLPETNLEFVANMAARFGAPGVPGFLLPFAPPKCFDWLVSQGVAGEHTHRGAYEHAFDFEIVDGRGFPFAGDGSRLEHYFAFGAPVQAPAAGTVAAVHDGDADGAPGDLDAARPWGNAVVLQHGPQLYTVLAHLRRGSLRVRPGQQVGPGDVLAQCGSSGRSPRPHLHFQVQRSAELGAPSLPCRFLHYRVDQAAVHAHGVPVEGERLAPLPPAPLSGLFRFLLPGSEAEFEGGATGPRLRVASEVSPLGERWLRDVERGDRLYFIAGAHEVVFTTHTGPADAPLRALLLALPRLPYCDAEHFAFTDAPPKSVMLSPVQRCWRACVRLVFDPFTTRCELQAQRAGELLLVDSRGSCGWRRRPVLRCRGRVELDGEGLRLFELSGPEGPPVLSLRRRGATPAPLPIPLPLEV